MARSVLLLFVLVSMGDFLASGCGGSGTGACSMDNIDYAGSYGLQACHDDITSADCASMSSETLNGTTWTYHDGQSCSDIGFSYECASGTYTPSATLCCGGGC
jgi:hypothetical protein